jgi:putative DNA primase/helicase
VTAAAVAARLHARRTGSGWMARCPAHPDKIPSLSISESGGRVLLHCYANCSTESIVTSLGLTMADLFSDGGKMKASVRPKIVAVYNYTDESGTLLYQVLRYSPKNFRQRRPDGRGGWIWNLKGVRRVLYRLPEVQNARTVVICEGEKDCEAARNLDVVATCNPGGAGKWQDEYSECLRGKRIAIIADADEPGRRHAQQVATSLAGKTESLKVIELPGSKDLSDWIAAGGNKDALKGFMETCPEWTPTKSAAPCAIMRQFSEIKPELLRWLWPGRIPLGKLTLLVGDPGLGKSLATIDIAARVSRGASFPDGAACEPGAVILASAEDDPGDTIRPRLDNAGADVARVHTLEGMRVTLSDNSTAERPFDLEAGIATLEDALARVPGVRLIIVDPISAYLGSADSNTNADVRGILAPLAILAAKHAVAVLCVTHLRKSSGPAVHRAIASIAFTAAARAVWAIAADPSDADRRLMLAVKQNLGPNIGGLAFRVETQNGLPRLNWEPGAVSVDANDVLGDHENHSERAEAEQWLRDYLANGPVGARETIRAANDVGVTRTTLWRAAAAIGAVKHKLGGRGAGWEWSLPDSKNPTRIYTDVDSLDSLNRPLKTKADSEAVNSKNPVGIYKDLGSLPLTEGEDDGEVRL